MLGQKSSDFENTKVFSKSIENHYSVISVVSKPHDLGLHFNLKHSVRHVLRKYKFLDLLSIRWQLEILTKNLGLHKKMKKRVF